MRSVVATYFAAMRRGSDAEEEMMSLFAEAAVYSEPFIAPNEPAVGKDEIRHRLRAGWADPLPEMELDVLEVTLEDGYARSIWECRSPRLPGPVRGEDRYEIVDGLITRLEVRITEGSGGLRPS